MPTILPDDISALVADCLDDKIGRSEIPDLDALIAQLRNPVEALILTAESDRVQRALYTVSELYKGENATPTELVKMNAHRRGYLAAVSDARKAEWHVVKTNEATLRELAERSAQTDKNSPFAPAPKPSAADGDGWRRNPQPCACEPPYTTLCPPCGDMDALVHTDAEEMDMGFDPNEPF